MPIDNKDPHLGNPDIVATLLSVVAQQRCSNIGTPGCFESMIIIGEISVFIE
jgi:hypothetical protein